MGGAHQPQLEARNHISIRRFRPGVRYQCGVPNNSCGADRLVSFAKLYVPTVNLRNHKSVPQLNSCSRDSSPATCGIVWVTHRLDKSCTNSIIESHWRRALYIRTSCHHPQEKTPSLQHEPHPRTDGIRAVRPHPAIPQRSLQVNSLQRHGCLLGLSGIALLPATRTVTWPCHRIRRRRILLLEWITMTTHSVISRERSLLAMQKLLRLE